MNILIFSWRGPNHPHAGGAEESTHQHAKAWVKAGHSVTLFTSEYPGCKEIEVIDGVRIIRRGNQNLGVHLAAFQWYLFENDKKYDLVVDQFHGIPFFTPLYVKSKKMAFIHEVTKEVWWMNPWPIPFNLVPAIFGSLFEPLVFRILYKNIPFITVSESTQKDLVYWDIPQNNIYVVNNGIKRINIKKIVKEKINTIIFLGALSKDKGVEDALETFSLLSKEDRNWRFWVVGKGETKYVNFLQIKARKLKLDGLIKFWGFVSEEKKYGLLSKAHLLINTSIREGWGLVVIEAASVGTPTVAYNVPGLRDSVLDGKTGLLCSINPYECFRMIKKVLNDKKYYLKMQNKAIKWSRNFSWERSQQKSLSLIESLVYKN